MNNSLTLQGASSATVTVTAAINTASVFTVTASNVNISGFTVSGATGGGQAGIFLGAGVANCNISNNILTGSFDGIWLGSGSNHNTITNNTLSNNYQGFEVYISDHNTFTSNTANSNNNYGFKIDSGNHNEFTSNIANSNTKNGFYVVTGDGGGCTNTIFTDNTANLNTEYGIRINGGSGNTLKENTFDSNVISGIRLKETMSTLTLKGNTFSNNPIGIEITDSVDDVSTWIVSHNNIERNTAYGISNDAVTGTLDAENNWWGDASGPTHASNPGGTGDAVSDNVDYDPWLGAELTEVKLETISGSGTMTDTAIGGQVTINGVGNHTITTAAYANNPGGACPFISEGSYYDVHLDSAANVTSLTVQFCPAYENEVIYFWNSAAWVEASNQVDSGGCIVLTITDETMPSLSDLTGTPFGQGFLPPVGGEAYPVNKAGLILPWIALGMAIIAGGFIVMKRRSSVRLLRR